MTKKTPDSMPRVTATAQVAAIPQATARTIELSTDSVVANFSMPLPGPFAVRNAAGNLVFVSLSFPGAGSIN